ncbi:LytTR family DNA-binding domain-containing protein [Runella sp. MFBS21]|uniref:LytR/AlgR family response regulator transcription factor n=1 Tax=Runella sp. MFBS21 TaxID=3034018 RepID=UPI0023F76A45|nr:LytTR family DNA-binding domain-containing protein [Runella sp. MFBS21]MDF7817025.1 LytTR family DNA-binding domain-containing protein [Runella sp. MFBS21]
MKVLIVEDEILIAEQLQRMLKDIAPQVEVLDILHSVKTARRWFMQNAEPDLLFMDIQLSDGISFDLFNYFDIKCPIIFATAYDEYAIKAFKVNGIDYLLKPIDEEDLIRALEKFKAIQKNNTISNELLQSLVNHPSHQNRVYKEKLIVQHRNASLPIMLSDIDVFYLDQVIYVVTHDGQKYVAEQNTLDEIEDILNPSEFFRAGRRQIINQRAIESYKGDTSGKLYVKLKNQHVPEVEISREKAPVFKRWIDR